MAFREAGIVISFRGVEKEVGVVEEIMNPQYVL